MTSVGKLYRPNEAIKSGRRRVITAYKDARKILPIPATPREESARAGRKEDGRPEVGGRVRCERVRVFFPLAPRVSVGLTRRLFLFLPAPKFDRLNPNTGGVEFPARESERTRRFYREAAGCRSLHANDLANATDRARALTGRNILSRGVAVAKSSKNIRK